MTSKEFENIILPLKLIPVDKHREFVTSAVRGNFNRWNEKNVNSHDSLVEALKEVSPLLDGLINRTPTGTKRNELCDINIKVKSVLSSL